MAGHPPHPEACPVTLLQAIKESRIWILQKDPKIDPSISTTTRERMTPTITVMTMSA